MNIEVTGQREDKVRVIDGRLEDQVDVEDSVR
jgi:hypothetical protein